MHLTPNQTIKVTSVKTNYQPNLSSSQSDLRLEPQEPQRINPIQQKSESAPHNHLLYSHFRNLACVGQIGSAIIALALAIELASSLTVAMVILGILWIACEQFGSVDS